MTHFIIIFGALTCVAGILILFNPEMVFGFFRKHSEKLELHITAVAIRLVLGVFLLAEAGASRYPLAIEVIGWLSIIAAVFFAVIGRNNFRRIMNWAMSLVKPWGRAGGVVAACFGAFLVHAFI